MKEKTRKGAERAALAQRVQLAELHEDLQVLETEASALESRAGRQSVALRELDEEMARITQHLAEAGRLSPHPKEPDNADIDVDIADYLQVPARERSAHRERPHDLSRIFMLPEAGDDWDAYLGAVDRYLADRGIEVARDPLEQLLPADRAAAICRRFDAEFSPAPWDRWDYGAVTVAVLVGAILDYLLVATPGKNFKGEPQRGSPLTKWMREQSEKLAPIRSSDNIERNAFQTGSPG